MRKVLTLVAVLGLAFAIGGVAGALASDIDVGDATISGVKYDWWGDVGELSIVGEPGTTFDVYDSFGNPVGGGVLDSPYVSFLVGNSGQGPDNTVVWVIVDSEIVGVTDPDWQWD